MFRFNKSSSLQHILCSITLFLNQQIDLTIPRQKLPEVFSNLATKPVGVIKKELPPSAREPIVTTRDITKIPKISTLTPSQASQLEAEGYTRTDTVGGGYTLSAPEKSYDSAYYYKDKRRETKSYTPKVLEYDSQGRLVKETTYEPQTVYSTTGYVLRSVSIDDEKVYDYKEGVVTTTDLPPPRIGGSLTIPERRPEVLVQQEQIGITGIAGGRFETAGDRIGYAAGGVAQIRGERGELLVEQRQQEFQRAQTERLRRRLVVERLVPKVARGVKDGRLLQDGARDRITPIGPSDDSLFSDFMETPTGKALRGAGELIVAPFRGAGKVLLSEAQARQDLLRAVIDPSRQKELFPIARLLGTAQRRAELMKEPDVQAFTMVAGTSALIALAPITAIPIGAAVTGLGAYEIYKGKVEEDYFRMGAGAVMLLGGLPLVKGAPTVFKSSRFVEQVYKAPPPRLKGRTFFGTEERIIDIRADVIRRAPGIEVREPGKIPFERRIIRTPKEILTTAVGKDTFIVQDPTGRQVTTRLGRGEFKDYFVRTVTEPMGVGRTQVFRVEPEGFKLLKTREFKSQEGVVLTEALPSISRPKGEPFVEEMKAADVTLRIKQEALAGKILPTTRDGYVPEGTFTRAYTESIRVATDVPKLELVKTEKSLKLEFAKTQFELVEYKPVAETAVFETVEGIPRGAPVSRALKPVEFTQIAETRAGQVFDIQFRKLGKPPRPAEAVKPPTEPPLAGEFLASFGKPAERFTPFEYPAPEPFTGKGARTFDLRKIGIDTRGADVTIAPQEVVQRVQTARMEAPALRDIRLFTEPVPGLVAARPVLVSPVLRQVPIAETLPEGVSRADVFSESIAKSVSESISESLSETRSFSVSESESISKSVSESLSRSLTETMTLTQTMTQTLAQAFAPRTGLGGFMPPTPGVPMLPPVVPPSFAGRGRNQDVFNVLVREARPKGKARISEVRVNEKPIPYNKALNVADRYVDETSARTFRLVKVGRKEVVDDSLFFDEYKYRRAKGASKINPKSFIEKSLYAIDSEGERRSITAKGLKALERKRRGFVKRLF